MSDKISSIVTAILPDFIENEYEVFVSFVKAYYEFLEEEGNTLNFIERFQDGLDIDLADEDFLTRFTDDFLIDFPVDVLIPTPMLIRNIKNFYRSKGSKEAYEFIFRILYDTGIEMIYPKELLLRPSDGKFVNNEFIYITADNDFKLDINDDELFSTVTGRVSGAVAVVDTITSLFHNNKKIYKVDISSDQGTFIPGETVDLAIEDDIVIETIFGLLSSIEISTPGNSYTVDDKITISDSAGGTSAQARVLSVSLGGYENVTVVSGGTGYVVGDFIYADKTIVSSGYGFVAQVSKVDGSGAILNVRIDDNGYDFDKNTKGVLPSSAGTGADLDLSGNQIGNITRFQVFDPGIDYTTVGTVSITVDSVDGSGIVATPIITSKFKTPDLFENSDGMLDSYSRIIDSFYWQQFSYAIKSSTSFHLWGDMMKKLMHPGGQQLFGIFSLDLSANIDIKSAILSDITHGMRYVFNAILNQPTSTNTIIHKQQYVDLSCSLSNNEDDFDQNKFLPVFTYPISEFYDITIGEFYDDDCPLPTKYTIDSEITIT